jgi:hypothetical protein
MAGGSPDVGAGELCRSWAPRRVAGPARLSGALGPAVAGEAPGDEARSAQRLVVAWAGSRGADPDEAADIVVARAGGTELAVVVAPGWAALRETRGAGAAGARVSGCAAGVTVPEGAIVASRRTGTGSGSVARVAAAAADAGTGCSAAGASTVVAGAVADPCAARRWTGRVGIGACDVRLGTGWAWATTRPGGADGPASWPSGVTMGGSGRWPETSWRNGAAGATSGGAPTVRWIAGSEAQAPVGGATALAPLVVAAGVVDARAPTPPSSGCVEGGPSGDVLRPKGQGRRTGLTPPRTGAC